ncbi:hypothetical protein VN97_g12754 [Penicillium thymicola]|uniref:Uncharacterized protein n=1 Tax=Penicillium thymicola TaxID=293382 RepID=A0AAI9T577_PENTH|nr:hypothetical protein VN97_g12754 [Penicillium thymicola]
MTTTSRNPHCVLKNKAVLVSIPDSEFSCRTRLFIAHDKTVNEGAISIRFTAQLANLGGRSQVLTFIIPPEIVGNCELVSASDDGLCPYRFLPKLPAPETNVSDVSTLRLILNETGIVLCPSGMESLSPANPTDLDFAAFANICKSTYLLLHISQRQFADEELGQLKTFLGALRKRSLREKLFDTKRQRMVRTTWRVFSPPDPPSYCDTLVSKQQVDPPRYEQSVPKQVIGKKRGRDPWSPDERQRKLLLTSPPSGSPSPSPTPTEINTSSVPSLSPASIRPTNFTHASSPDCLDHNGLTRLAHELRGFSDDQIRELIIRSGRQHLLAMSENTDLPSEFEKVGFANFEIIKQYVDKMIERRLKLHVVDIDKIVDRTVSDFGHHEVDILEQVQAGNSEVNNTASECIEEIDKQAQKHVSDMKEQAQQHELDMEEQAEQRLREIEIAEQRLRDMEKKAEQRLRDIEKQGFELENEFAKLKRWLNVSAQSLLNSQSSPGQRGPEARRISI